MTRGTPNWWVILAVSLALMALLTATAGQRHPTSLEPSARAALTTGDHKDARSSQDNGPGHHGAPRPAPAVTGTPVTVPDGSPSLLVAGSGGGTEGARGITTPSTTTPTTVPASTTTTVTLVAGATPAAAGRLQTQGYIDPPAQTSESFSFTGTSTMQVAVQWSSSTYLTLQVSCPGATQSAGGTAAMAASVPDATGTCTATVAEPGSEMASVSFTITIGPAGG